MIKNRLISWFKTYFYLSTGEKKGALALLILIILAIGTPVVYQYFMPQRVIAVEWVHDTISSVESQPYVAHNKSKANDAPSVQQSPFNPNEADKQTWIRAGLKPWQAKNVNKYIQRGGRFKYREDIKKIYGLTEAQYNQIAPLLILPEKTPALPKDSIPIKKAKRIKIELNTADSQQLVDLYGIGPKMASKIIEYRKRLGGFYHMNQLTEIWGFNEDVLYDLHDKLWIDTTLIEKIHINFVTQEQLGKHPYIRIKASKVIVNFREQHGPYNKPTDLLKTHIMHDTTIQKLTPYLNFKLQ